MRDLDLASEDLTNCAKGMTIVINPSKTGRQTPLEFKASALRTQAKVELKKRQLVQAQAPSQVASIVSIAPQGQGAAAQPAPTATIATGAIPMNGTAALPTAAQPTAALPQTTAPANGGNTANGATPAASEAPAVIAGQGTTGNGQACGCQCLCGMGSFPANAGQGAFGGFLGTCLSSLPQDHEMLTRTKVQCQMDRRRKA